MKTLMATLFFLGIPWLFLVLPAVLSPIGIFLPEYRYQMRDVIFSLLTSTCGLLGIVVWLGYRLRWKLGSFVWLTNRQFWCLSLIHHIAWIFLIPSIYRPRPDEPYRETLAAFWFGGGANPYGIWISLCLLISLFSLFFDHETPEFKRQNKP